MSNSGIQLRGVLKTRLLRICHRTFAIGYTFAKYFTRSNAASQPIICIGRRRRTASKQVIHGRVEAEHILTIHGASCCPKITQINRDVVMKHKSSPLPPSGGTVTALMVDNVDVFHLFTKAMSLKCYQVNV